LFSKSDLIAFLADFSLGSGVYNHAFLSSISPRGVNGELILPTKNPCIFWDGSLDYGSESMGGFQGKPLEDDQLEVRVHPVSLEIINRFGMFHQLLSR